MRLTFIWTPQDSMLHVCLSTTTHMCLGILFFSNLGVVPLSTFQILFFQPFRKMKKIPLFYHHSYNIWARRLCNHLDYINYQGDQEAHILFFKIGCEEADICHHKFLFMSKIGIATFSAYFKINYYRNVLLISEPFDLESWDRS